MTENQKKKKNNQSIERVSFSEFKTWSECSYKHKLIYLDKLSHFSGNEFTAFGTAIHYVCETLLADTRSTPDCKQIFLEKFEEELSLLKSEVNLELASQMKEQAITLVDFIMPAIIEEYGKFEVVAIEEPIMEPITEFDSFGKKFKGFIDLVIKKGEEYHIIDWKSCSWGWDQKKKSDKILGYQLIFYKNFFAKKYNIEPEKIKTSFALLKRTAKKNRVEFVHISSGQRKMNNALNSLELALVNIDRKNTIKNRLSCRYCDFHNTEHCLN